MFSQPKSLKSPLVNDNRPWQMPPKPWRFVLITVLVIGIFFRFANLDRKVYWLDEVKAAYKISGYEYVEYQQRFNGQIISPKDFQKYGYPKPESTIADTVKILTKEDSKHVPLYFIILRLWVDCLGNSIAVIRSLSAVISLLAIPFMYWLCLELFDSLLAGLIGAASIAISPFFVLYAQEARPYSLWTVTILLSSWFLLRAIRLPSKLNWGLYGLSIILSIYTHTLSVLFVISHTVYVLLSQGFRSIKVLIAHLITVLISFIAFLPWFRFIFINQEELSNSVEWHSIIISGSSLVNWWIINLSRIFLDIDPTYSIETDFSSFKNALSISLIAALLVIFGYSIYYLIRHSNPKTRWFILTIITIPALALAIPDVFGSGIRSTAARYFVPSYIGILLSITYLLSSQINSQLNKFWQQKLWIIVAALLVASGVFSCGFISLQKTWWNKYMNSEIPKVAKIINQANHPLVIIDHSGWSQNNGLSLSYFLDSKVRLQLLADQNLSEIPKDFRDIFLFAPSEDLLNEIKQKREFKLEQISPMVFSATNLFKVRFIGND